MLGVQLGRVHAPVTHSQVLQLTERVPFVQPPTEQLVEGLSAAEQLSLHDDTAYQTPQAPQLSQVRLDAAVPPHAQSELSVSVTPGVQTMAGTLQVPTDPHRPELSHTCVALPQPLVPQETVRVLPGEQSTAGHELVTLHELHCPQAVQDLVSVRVPTPLAQASVLVSTPVAGLQTAGLWIHVPLCHWHESSQASFRLPAQPPTEQLALRVCPGVQAI